eukprot:10387158-Lingulodinium_polyedra.AAC.1
MGSAAQAPRPRARSWQWSWASSTRCRRRTCRSARSRRPVAADPAGPAGGRRAGSDSGSPAPRGCL